MTVRTSAIISYQPEEILIIDSNDELPDSIDMPNLKTIWYRHYNKYSLPYHPKLTVIVVENTCSYVKLPDPKNVPNLKCLELNSVYDYFPKYPKLTSLRICNSTKLPDPKNVPKLENLYYFSYDYYLFFIPYYKNLQWIGCNVPFETPKYFMDLKRIIIQGNPDMIVNGIKHKPKFLLELGAKLILVNLSRHIKEKYILAEIVKQSLFN
jgi:hypothetical protein